MGDGITMRRISWGLVGLGGAMVLLLGAGDQIKTSVPISASQVSPQRCQPKFKPSRFLTVAGGGAPSYNEIAIEKNVLYFQRTLEAMGLPVDDVNILFANGTDGRKTVRFMDKGEEKFKAPTIPGILGESSIANLASAFESAAKQPTEPLFFYFTGHGAHNSKNLDNNSMILWDEEMLNVQKFGQMLDELPSQKPVVAVMVQCYSGSFANMIYQGGDPKKAVAPQHRCGFFATVKELPSVGCTAEVDEADYRDYSSSFFAGLSGMDRVGRIVEWADYDKDGRVSYREAHGFAKVDEQASDLPLSTSEAWLQRQMNKRDMDRILRQPMGKLRDRARPEQIYVVDALVKRLGMEVERSFVANRVKKNASEMEETYRERLRLELGNIGAEVMVRESGDQAEIGVLDRLLKCEGGSWK